MNPQDLLAQQLRDIHSAPDVAWWPPAPGWWIVAFLLLVLLFFVARKVTRHLRDRHRKTVLLGFIEDVERDLDPDQSPQQFLAGLNRVFKIVALKAFPDERCAHLQGREWVSFLAGHLPAAGEEDVLLALAEGPWQPSPAFDAQRLSKLARQWVKLHG